MSNTKKETAVISFRLPVKVVQWVDQQAKRERKKRAKYLETLFLAAFEIQMGIVELNATYIEACAFVDSKAP